MGNAVRNRDSLPVMVSYGVSKMISDSGVMRYKIVAEEWKVYDKTKPPRQDFLKGIFLERLNDKFNVDLYITADTAHWYNQNLWELRGRVFVRNFANGTIFRTEELFWNMQEHKVYSKKHMYIKTPDREVVGNSFVSNEQMTKYERMQSSGYMPLPSHNGSLPDSTATGSAARPAPTTRPSNGRQS